MKTYEQFTFNEKIGLSNEQIQKGLEIVQSKMPLDKFVKYLKKHKKELKYVLDKFTNGKDTILTNKLLVKNEGFKYSIIYTIFIEPFIKNSSSDWVEKTISGFMWLSAIFIGFLMYALSVTIYLNVFYTPMEKGIIQKKEYRESYTTKTPIYQKIGKIQVKTGDVTVYHPESYSFELKELTGNGTEIWKTENMSIGNNIHRGDTISWNDVNYDVLKGM